MRKKYFEMRPLNIYNAYQAITFAADIEYDRIGTCKE